MLATLIACAAPRVSSSHDAVVRVLNQYRGPIEVRAHYGGSMRERIGRFAPGRGSFDLPARLQERRDLRFVVCPGSCRPPAERAVTSEKPWVKRRALLIMYADLRAEIF